MRRCSMVKTSGLPNRHGPSEQPQPKSNEGFLQKLILKFTGKHEVNTVSTNPVTKDECGGHT